MIIIRCNNFILLVAVNGSMQRQLRYQTQFAAWDCDNNPKCRVNCDNKSEVMEKSIEKKNPNSIEKVAKHRFDCVNLALKDTKAILQERIADVETLAVRVAELEGQLSESKLDVLHLLRIMARLTNP